MIRCFEAENYACLKDVRLTLTPLHAFVGPNDSGKTMLLNAIHDLVTCAVPSVPRSSLAHSLHAETPVGLRQVLRAHLADDLVYEFERSTGQPPVERVRDHSDVHESVIVNSNGSSIPLEVRGRYARELAGLQYIHFTPASFRNYSSNLMDDLPTIRFESDQGAGLARMYDWLLRQVDGRYDKVIDELRSLFPAIQRMQPVPQKNGGPLTLKFTLRDGSVVGMHTISEGVLYFLAFRALSFAEPMKILLLEEPESGLHPARIAEVMHILRDITERDGTQVILTTHSPLVVNELKPDEVSVITRTPEEGTRARLIRDTPNFAARSKVYALGELWLAYCNGADEAPLLKGLPAEGPS